jgi:hypothetical protein
MELVTQTRLSSNSVDSYNLPVIVRTDTTLNAAVSPRTTTKTVGASETTIIEGLTLYLDAGVVVNPTDEFTVRGQLYLVDGEAFDWHSGIGNWNPGVVVNLRRSQNV